jgi:hypothetical protein
LLFQSPIKDNHLFAKPNSQTREQNGLELWNYSRWKLQAELFRKGLPYLDQLELINYSRDLNYFVFWLVGRYYRESFFTNHSLFVA